MKGRMVLLNSLFIFVSAVIMILTLSMVIHHIKPCHRKYLRHKMHNLAASYENTSTESPKPRQIIPPPMLSNNNVLTKLKPVDLFLLLVFWGFAILFHRSCRKLVDAMQHTIEHESTPPHPQR